MKMDEIRKIAVARGIKPKKLTKTALVRSIQLNEGNFDCFGSATAGSCNQANCLWSADCIKQSATNAA